MPAPPPPPAYGAPPSAGGAFSPTAAIQYGWAKFTKSPSTLLVPALIFIVAIVIVEVIVGFVLGNTVTSRHDCTRTILGTELDTTCGPGVFRTLLGAGIGAGIVTFVSLLLGAGLIKSALNVVDGREVNVGDIVSYASKSAVVTTAGLIAAATAVGTFFFYLPGIIISILTVFAMYCVVDTGMEGMDAVKAGLSFLTGNLGNLIVFYILGIVVLIVGAILCGIGLLAAIPVVLAAAAYTFRVLNNEPVTPAA
jgi:uncharacterized membrane protein